MTYNNYVQINRDGLIYEALMDGWVPSWSSATDVSWVNSEKGYTSDAGSFNGSSSRVHNSNTSWDYLTYNYWVNPTFSGWNGMHIHTRNWAWANWYWSVDTATTNNNYAWIRFYLKDGWTNANLQAENILTAWEWQMITVKYDWSKVYIYKNAVEVTSANFAHWTLPNPWWSFGIGESNPVSWPQNYFKWYMWLNRVHNHSASQDEMDNWYQEWLRKFWPTQSQVEYNPLLDWSLIADFDSSMTVSGATKTTGRLWDTNWAYNFSADQINTNKYASLSWSISYGCWFKATDKSHAYDTMIGRWGWNAWHFNIRKWWAGSWIIYADIYGLWTNTIYTTTDYYDGNWHFAFATWNDSTKYFALYIDGNLEDSVTTTWSLSSDSSNVTLWHRTNDRYFYGDMDLPFLYNRELTSTEVTNLYNQTSVEDLEWNKFPKYSLTSLEWEVTKQVTTTIIEWNWASNYGNSPNSYWQTITIWDNLNYIQIYFSNLRAWTITCNLYDSPSKTTLIHSVSHNQTYERLYFWQKFNFNLTWLTPWEYFFQMSMWGLPNINSRIENSWTIWGWTYNWWNMYIGTTSYPSSDLKFNVSYDWHETVTGSKVLEYSRPQSGWVYYDQSGNWNNGTPNHVTDSTLGLNNVMSFNWTSSAISFTWTEDVDWDITVNATIKIDTITNNYGIYSLNDTTYSTTNRPKLFHFFIYQWKLRIYRRTTRWVDDATPTFFWNTTLTTWKYYNVSMVWKNSTWNIEFFIDWVSDWSWTITTWTITWLTKWIGRFWNWSWWWIHYFDWDIITPSIYNRALSDNEVQQDFYSNFIQS